MLKMPCALLQTGHERKNKSGYEIFRAAHDLPASPPDGKTLPERTIIDNHLKTDLNRFTLRGRIFKGKKFFRIEGKSGGEDIRRKHGYRDVVFPHRNIIVSARMFDIVFNHFHIRH